MHAESAGNARSQRMGGVALLASVVLFAVSVFPMVRALLEVKQAVMLAAAAAAALGAVAAGRMAIHRDIVVWWAVTAAALALAAVQGILRATPGATREAAVYIVWPIVHLLYLPVLREPVLRWLGQVLLWATIAIGVMGIYFVASMAQLVPQFVLPVWLTEESGFAVSFLDGFVRARFLGINSLPFLLPYCLSALLVGQGVVGRRAPALRFLVIAAVVIGVICALVSTRRALWVVLPLAVLLTVAFATQLPGGWRRLPLRGAVSTLAAVIMLVASVPVLLASRNILAGGGISTYVGEGFSRRGNDVAAEPNIRANQAELLIDRIAEAPLLGHGLGSYAPRVIRDFLRPWSYELYYLALAMQVGILGLLILTAGIGWIVWTVIQRLRADDPLADLSIPMTVGMLCYLVAAATNPYLPRFDGLWVIFLPLAVLNQSLLASPHRSARDVDS